MSKDVHPSDVLTPSAASVGFCIAGLIIAVFFIVLPRLGGDAFLSLLFGKDASLSLINSSKENYGPLIEQLLSNDLLGRAVVFGLWAFVGLCTFVLITTITSFFETVEEQGREMSYIHTNKESLLRNNFLTVAYRIGIAALWAVFISLCIRYVLSYFAVTGFVALGGSGGAADWLIFLVAAAILYVSLHIQVIFARLLAGRTRIWYS